MWTKPKHLALVWLALAAQVAGCKQAAAPAPKSNQDKTSTGTAGDATVNTGTQVQQPFQQQQQQQQQQTILPLALEVIDALSVPANQPARVRFQIVGAAGRTVLVGLLQGPAGISVQSQGTIATMTWPSPTAGAVQLQFLLRDLVRCQAAEPDPSRCQISQGSSTNVGLRSYDVPSDSFTLNVAGAGGTGTGIFGSTPGAVGNPGLPGFGTNGVPGGGGDKAQLVAQILQTVGAVAGGQLGNTLQQLSQGQLAQVLQQVQSNGGHLSVLEVLQILGI